jgi:hypothetical protein
MQSSIVTEDGVSSITVISDGQILVANNDHPNYNEIVEYALAGDPEVVGLFDASGRVAERFEKLSERRVTVANSRVYFDGDEIHNSLTEAIVRFMNEGIEDWKGLVKFFEKIQTNPTEHSREQFFSWLKDRDFTITDDGDVIMYKGLTYDGYSVHGGTAIVDGETITGKIPNNIGSVIEMPRSAVAHDPGSACSTGLHAADYGFANQFSSGQRIVRIIVNPRDVVSVPSHGQFNKVRVCRYKVDKVVHEPYSGVLLSDSVDQENEANSEFVNW